jgi:ubiquinone/menaquinone biosynthesis C-methylase UbiE
MSTRHLNAMRSRYDNGARLYARFWAPVLLRSAESVADRLEALDGARPRDVVDLGTGTGSLARAVARRFPETRVTGIDFSAGMLAVARAIADEDPTLNGRVTWLEADAADLPVAERSVDAVVSSFVLQLVPKREPVYREVRRVLRPGGRFLFTTWMVDDSRFEPSEAFEDALDELRIDVDEGAEEERAGDFPSARAAAASLRDAGFEAVKAERGTLEFAYTPESYAEYKLRYDDRELVDGLRPSVRRRLEGCLRDKLAALPPDDFVLRAKIVYASAREPGDRAKGS